MAGCAIGDVDLFALFLVLCRRRSAAGHGEHEEAEKRDHPLGHKPFTFYFEVFPYSRSKS